MIRRSVTGSLATLVLGGLVWIGCSSSDSPPAAANETAVCPGEGATAADGSAAGITLTSNAFAECATIPADYTCVGGADVRPSPPLSWTAGPAGTAGYAIVLKDTTNGFTHWAIWDIPPTTTTLAADVPQTTHVLTDPAGALQSSGKTEMLGYIPPCPPAGTHTYVFTVYAQSVLPLANVTAALSAVTIASELGQQSLTTGSLSALVTR
jgi:Raf kinase inhibitor-like YbhB/YbcL family protein